jgi:hypothetical protein
MYGSERVRIGRAANGYTVTMTDPKIAAANAKRDSSKGPYTPYVDPDKEYVFTDIKSVMTFLTANLDKALPKVDYDSSFELASEEAEDND